MSSSTAADHTVSRAADLLRRARQLTMPLMRVAVDTLPSELRLMVGYHLGWYTADGSATTARAGKGLRPALVLAAAAAAGGRPTAALHAAAAVEMVHNFTLIHDDVMDGDTVRRGRPTVWRLWGVDDAVLVGDALHSLAIWTLADAPAGALDAIARLEDAVIEVCLGQHRGHAADQHSGHADGQHRGHAAGQHRGRAPGPEALRHRNSALLGCACAMGALCAGAPTELVAAMDQLGRDLGHPRAAASARAGHATADLLALAECVARA
ncbi:polyprenyl synthetase family protein [Nocardia sp. CDC160]|uniref:polyprenyl synthetase family protein n=1 Tax=Nocardia sp. CDC160 TaxID=3112166 RepID=UPI002DB8C655|nr:polyprenyl synthetase family protein [Nocardia sp. CDC160]MEC3916264.1 polyprenyl synthetase family protein [Nocardia sp. CDC160]